jgi:tRNA(fMet)-specific endonuclease VapC
LKYLLDTNACIGLINERPACVRAQFDKALGEGSEIFASSIVVFELWYGVAKSQRREMNGRLLAGFLSGPVQQISFDEEDARFAGELRAAMEAIGRPVGDYDLLIAGQALHHRMTLVTANVREFGRVKDLVWEDWSKS